MRNLIILLIGLALPTLSLGQKGFSFGVQSNNGIGRLSIESQPSSSLISTQPGFVTGGSLFIHWNFIERFGVRLQADGLSQSLSLRITDQGNFASGSGWTFGQGAVNLQANVNFPLNPAKTLHVEAFAGFGIRSGGIDDGGCGAGIGGTFDQDDTVAIANVNASRLINNGIQPEVMGGFRFVQQISQSTKRPIYLTFGLGYRQALSPVSTLRGISFSEEVALMRDQNGFLQFPIQDILGNCLESFEDRPEDGYTVQHFGQQIEMQVGLKIGL